MRGIQLIATKNDPLKESTVIAGWLKAPALKVHSDELGRRVQTARRGVAAFHFVRSNE